MGKGITSHLIEGKPRSGHHKPDRTGLTNEPWLTRDVITYLGAFVKPHHRVLEFGAGGSTVWFAPRCEIVYSIEGSDWWATTVVDTLAYMGRKNVLLYYRPYEPSSEGREKFRAAVSKVVEELPVKEFDVVLVDGRCRVHCAEISKPLVKPGGILILDNSERPRYEPIHRLMEGWYKMVSNNTMWETTVWRRPMVD